MRLLKEDPIMILCGTIGFDPPMGEPGDHESCPAYDAERNLCFHLAWFKAKSKKGEKGRMVGPFYECPREAK